MVSAVGFFGSIKSWYVSGIWKPCRSPAAVFAVFSAISSAAFVIYAW